MPIYFIITKIPSLEYDGWGWVSDGNPADYYEAPTRGKAKHMFCAEHDLEFTTQVKISKVVDCLACDNEGYSYVGECPKCKGKSYRDDVRYIRRRHDEQIITT